MKKRILSWLLIVCMVLALVPHTFAANTVTITATSNRDLDTQLEACSAFVEGTNDTEPRLKGGTRTWDVPLNIVLDGWTKAAGSDQAVTVFNRFDDMGYQYESPVTYVFNEPVTITVRNCSGPSFSLFSDGTETYPSVGHNFAQYIFNKSVTLNLEGCSFDNVYTQTHTYWIGLGYTNTVMTKWGFQFKDAYTVNLTNTNITGNFVGGVYKTAARGNPDKGGSAVTEIKSDWLGGFDSGVTVNLNGSTVGGYIGPGTCHHAKHK